MPRKLTVGVDAGLRLEFIGQDPEVVSGHGETLARALVRRPHICTMNRLNSAGPISGMSARCSPQSPARGSDGSLCNCAINRAARWGSLFAHSGSTISRVHSSTSVGDSRCW